MLGKTQSTIRTAGNLLTCSVVSGHLGWVTEVADPIAVENLASRIRLANYNGAVEETYGGISSIPACASAILACHARARRTT